MKTRKIVTKRFKVTKNKKVVHRVQGGRHIMRNKSGSRKRRQRNPSNLKTMSDRKGIMRQISS
jgi:ribosomal protein L35